MSIYTSKLAVKWLEVDRYGIDYKNEYWIIIGVRHNRIYLLGENSYAGENTHANLFYRIYFSLLNFFHFFSGKELWNRNSIVLSLLFFSFYSFYSFLSHFIYFLFLYTVFLSKNFKGVLIIRLEPRINTLRINTNNKKRIQTISLNIF